MCCMLYYMCCMLHVAVPAYLAALDAFGRRRSEALARKRRHLFRRCPTRLREYHECRSTQQHPDRTRAHAHNDAHAHAHNDSRRHTRTRIDGTKNRNPASHRRTHAPSAIGRRRAQSRCGRLSPARPTAGTACAFVATVITQPADMIKTRAQLQRAADGPRTTTLAMQICSVRSSVEAPRLARSLLA